jgi:ABC-type lipoprotein release transport system permease subunit
MEYVNLGATGMRVSFGSLLLSQGFQIRLAPKGTLPFDTDATIPDASNVVRTLMARPDVVAVSPVLGAQLHVEHGATSVSAAALGTIAAVQGDDEAKQYIVGVDSRLTPKEVDEAKKAAQDWVRSRKK